MDLNWFKYLLGLPISKSKLSNIKAYLLILINVSVFAAILFTLTDQRWVPFLISLFVLLAIWISRVIANKNNLVRPAFFEFIMASFLYASLILGEVKGFFYMFSWWDKILHFSSGIAFAFIGFLIFYSLTKNNRSTLLISLFAICLALAAGVVWEIAEFASDNVLGTTSQNGLNDTMWDLIWATVGAVSASVWSIVLFEK